MHSIYLVVVLPNFFDTQEAIWMGFLCLPRMMKSFSFSDRRFIEKTSIPKRSTIFSLSRRYAADHWRLPGVPGRRRYSGRVS